MPRRTETIIFPDPAPGDVPRSDLPSATFPQMGMTDLFEADKADLTRISRNGELYVTDAVHKAVIDVNEEGTVASAATGE